MLVLKLRKTIFDFTPNTYNLFIEQCSAPYVIETRIQVVNGSYGLKFFLHTIYTRSFCYLIIDDRIE